MRVSSSVLVEQITRRAKINNRVARHRDGAIFDQTEVAQAITALRSVIVSGNGQQLRSVGDEEINVHAVIIAQNKTRRELSPGVRPWQDLNPQPFP